MMDSTLAQLLNHVYELELENVQLKQEVEMLKRKLAGEEAAPPSQAPGLSQAPAFLTMAGRE